MPTASRSAESLSNFKRKTAKLLQRIKRTGKPLVLTVRGKAEVIVQDAESYQRLLEQIDRAEAVEGIKRGLESMQRGAGIPVKEAFEQIRREHGG